METPRFAIMATGGVGGAFGFRLARAGLPVAFLARGAHLAAIRAHGLTLETPEGAETLAVEATDDTAAIGPVDFVLFAVKLWDAEAAAEAARPLLGPQTAVVPFLNGVEAPDVLARVLGERHAMAGVAEISATIARPGVVAQMSPFATLRFGERDDARSPRAAALAAALGRAGIDHEHVANVGRTLWLKFIFLNALAATTALTRRAIGAVRAHPETRALLSEVIAETAAVGRARGVDLAEDTEEERLARIDALPEGMRASMALDLARGGRLELPWLAGAVVRLGREAGVPTPANAFVVRALALDADGSPGSG